MAWILLALSLAVRLAVIPVGLDFDLRGDSADYDRYAHSISEGHGYPQQVFGHRPGADRPPLYPYLLGGIYALPGGGRGAAIAAQAVLGTIAVGLLGLIAWRHWGRRVGLATLALAAIYPPLVAIGMVLLTETLFIVLELAAVAAALEYARGGHRLRWIVIAGVLAGLAALTRGNGLVLLIPLAAAAIAGTRDAVPRRRRAVPVLALVAAAVLTIAPWTIRNAVVLHEFVPVSTETGYNVAGAYNEISRRGPASWVPPQFLPAYRDRFHGPNVDQIDLDRDLTRDGLRYAARHPLYAVETTAANLLRMAQLKDDGRATSFEVPQAGPLNRLSFWAVLALAAAGALSAASRTAPRWLWFAPVLVVGSAAFVLGLVRLRAPADPFLVLLAAAALASGADRYWRRRAS